MLLRFLFHFFPWTVILYLSSYRPFKGSCYSDPSLMLWRMNTFCIRQAIVWTNTGILFIGPSGTNFSEILIEIHTFKFKKILWKVASRKWRPFCLGPNVLISNLCYFRQKDTVSTKKKQDATKKQKSTKILVRNVPFEAKVREVRELFSVFGELKTVRLPKKLSGTGSHRGFGFIDFVTKQDAKVRNDLCFLYS